MIDVGWTIINAFTSVVTMDTLSFNQILLFLLFSFQFVPLTMSSLDMSGQRLKQFGN